MSKYIIVDDDTQVKIGNSGKGGIGFVGLLTIAFIVLKLLGVINWSWLWVLSPIWISAILFIVLIIAILVVAKIISE